MISIEQFSTYKLILYIAIIAFTLLSIPLKQGNGSFNKLFTLLAIIIYGFIVGSRSSEVGTDTAGYLFSIEDDINLKEYFKDIGYTNFVLLIKALNLEPYFLYIMSALFLTPLYIIATDKTHPNSLLFIYLLFSFFFFYSLSINVMRQGIGISFAFLSLNQFKNNKLKKSIFPAIIAVMFHLSVLIFILSIFITHIKGYKIKYSIYFLATCVIISILNINILPTISNIPGFDLLSQNRLDSYIQGSILQSSTSYRTGFRFDFLTFNLFFSAIFFLAKKTGSFKKPIDLILLNSYLLLSGIFFLSFNLPYSDRIGVISWMIIPFLLYSTISHSPKTLSITAAIIPLVIYSTFSLL